MNIKELVGSILAEKDTATNKDKMGLLVDKAVAALNQIDQLPPDELSAGKIENLNKTIGEKDQLIVQLKGEVSDAQEIANEALSKLNTATNLIPKTLDRKVDGKNVTVNFGVNFEGKNYTAAELAENTAVISELIKIGSGAITIKEGK